MAKSGSPTKAMPSSTPIARMIRAKYGGILNGYWPACIQQSIIQLLGKRDQMMHPRSGPKEKTCNATDRI
eukprot:5248933-Amphidinium_carterae.1